MRQLAVKIALVVLGTVMPLVGLELAARVIKGKPITYFINFVEANQTLLRSVYPTQYDPDLGWIPMLGEYGSHNYWSKSITILDKGIRYNGRPNTYEHSVDILAVGDSFTFGDQVADHETWPAQLENIITHRVINGGVFGYGLDQTVLRAEQMADIYNPRVIIIGIIPQDILRTEFSIRSGASKPFFRLVAGKLDRGNSPVPIPTTESTEIGIFRGLLGYSFLVDGLMRQLGHEAYWYAGGWEDSRVHTDGAKVSCLLMDRVSKLGRMGETKLFLLVQYLERDIYADQASDVKKLIACARQNNIKIVDMYAHLRKIAESNPAKLESLYFQHSHMTPQGNAFVAKILVEYLMDNYHVGWTGNFISTYH